MLKERYNIMLTPTVVRIIDTVALRLNMSRSALILDILSDYIIENNLVFVSDSDDGQVPGQLEVI